MAYTPILNDILEARIVTFDPTAPSQVGVNVIHYKVTNLVGFGVTQLALAQRLDTLAAPLYKALMSSSVQYRGVLVQKIWPLPRVASEQTAANAGFASGAASQVPTQVAGLIKLKTANAGRAFRGRIYLPFLGTGSIGVDGNPTAPYVTALNNLAAAIFTPITGVSGGDQTTMVPGIYHAKGFGTPPIGAHTIDLTTSATGSPLAATQRKRGNYGRTNSTSPV